MQYVDILKFISSASIESCGITDTNSSFDASQGQGTAVL